MKILAIANAGGHFIQLLRLKPALEGNQLFFMSSKQTFSELVPDHVYYFVPDSNRKNKIKLITGFLSVLKIVVKLRPDIVITTGAALGLMGLIVGKLCNAKTIWVDSIANAEEISLSGKLASKFTDRCYTQWPELTDSKFIFEGNVLS
ncbi:MAG: oligosaccharide biosynthesis protein Alg14 [Fulvivirga sp.]